MTLPKPLYTPSRRHTRTTSSLCCAAFRSQCCSVCKVRKTAQPASFAIHITLVLQRVHWLPLASTYKVILSVYSAMNDLVPDFLADLLNRRRPIRQLRSTSLYLLSVLASQTVMHGDRRFAVAAANLRNEFQSGQPTHYRIINRFFKNTCFYSTFLMNMFTYIYYYFIATNILLIFYYFALFMVGQF